MKRGPYKKEPTPPCRVPGCPRLAKVKARALCNPHYLRFQRYDDPTAPRRKSPPWTAREDELVLALPRTRTGRAKPGTVDQLSIELGRSKHAIATRRHMLRGRRGAAKRC